MLNATRNWGTDTITSLHSHLFPRSLAHSFKIIKPHKPETNPSRVTLREAYKLYTQCSEISSKKYI